MIEKPIKGEYFEYFETYILKVNTPNVIDQLESIDFLNYLRKFTDEHWNYRYSEGKWTPKEMLMHIIDTERIFAYRAMCISRGDKTDLPSFDHLAYAKTYDADDRSAKSLIEEYTANRFSTLSMLNYMAKHHLQQVGMVAGHPTSVSALAYMIAGHELHHQYILETKYFPSTFQE